MRLRAIDDGTLFVDLHASGGENLVYDPADLGDLQKLVEYFAVFENTTEPHLPPTVQQALTQARQGNGHLPYHKPALDQAGPGGRSSRGQRARLAVTISRLRPGYDTAVWATAASAVKQDLLSIQPFMTPGADGMWPDDDGILELLSEAFQLLHARVSGNQLLSYILTKAPGYYIKGEFNFRRTMLDYLKDCQTDCAQAGQGEMDEWLRILDKREL